MITKHVKGSVWGVAKATSVRLLFSKLIRLVKYINFCLCCCWLILESLFTLLILVNTYEHLKIQGPVKEKPFLSFIFY